MSKADDSATSAISGNHHHIDPTNGRNLKPTEATFPPSSISPVPSAFDFSSPVRRKSAKKSSRQSLYFRWSVIGTAAVLLTLVLTWLLFSTNSASDPATIAKAKAATIEKPGSRTEIDGSNLTTADSSNDASETVESLTSIDSVQTTDNIAIASEPPLPSVEILMSQLTLPIARIGTEDSTRNSVSGTEPQKQIDAPENLSAQLIVSKSINSHGRTSEESQEEISSNTAETDSSPESVNDTDSNEAPGKLELKWPLDGKRNEHMLAIGRPVAVKKARCDAKLVADDRLIVEAMGDSQVTGIGRMTWKIAIEDVAPELVVELQSKPGMRWRFKASVSVRYDSASPTMPLGPNDANIIVSRLATYDVWLSQSIQAIRNAKANQSGRSFGRDYMAKLRDLEAEQKQVAIEIERWTNIVHLSELFFGTNSAEIVVTPSQE